MAMKISLESSDDEDIHSDKAHLLLSDHDDQPDTQITIPSINWATLLPWMFIYVMTNFCASVSMPYLSLEMQAHGMNSEVTAAVFSAHSWSAAAATLIAPYLYNIKKMKMLLLSTVGVNILADTAFAGIFLVPPNFLRPVGIGLGVIQGISNGLSGQFFCNTAYIVYSERIGTISGIVEVACDMGYLVAPIVGAFLYERLGFEKTTLICPAILVLMYLWMIVAPGFGTNSSANSEEDMAGAGYLQCFKSFPLLFLLLVPFITSVIYSLPVSFLAPYVVENYGLSSQYTGYVFTLLGLTYCVMCTVLGYWSDIPQFNHFIPVLICPVLMLLFSSVMFLSHILGTHLTYAQILWAYTGIGFGMGIGNGPILGALCRAWAYSKPGVENMTFITAIYLLSYPLGDGVGTSLGGYLYERMSFMEIVELQEVFLAGYSVLVILFVLTYGRIIHNFSCEQQQKTKC